MLTSIIAFVLQFLIRRFTSCGYRLTDPCLLLSIETFGVYFFILEFINIKNNKIQNIISYVSKYSYMFYLLHMFILTQVLKLFNLTISLKSNVILFVPIFLITFTVTLLLSIIISKAFLTPIQNKLINLTIKKEGAIKKVPSKNE